MTKTKLSSAVFLGIMVSPAFVFAAETSVIKETESMINVEGDFVNDPWYSNEKKLKYSPTSTPDTASMLERMPGANVNENGPLTGIVQYRGMFDDRVNIKVNNMKMVSACPNHMDPPLHYATRFRLDTLKIYRGIAPISSGLETIGGSVIASTREYDFTASKQYEFHGSALGGLSSVDSGYMGGVDLNMANEASTFTLGGFTEKGDDYSFNGGEVLPSKYKRSTGHFAAGFQQNGHSLGIDYEHGDTDYAGNAALPMDITSADSDTVKLNYDKAFGDRLFQAQLSYSYIDHTMDNYSLRTPPTPMRRESPTTSLGKGYDFTLDMPLANGALKLGMDGHLATHNAVILNPDNNNFFLDNFNNAERDLYGFFAEWEGEFAENWYTTAGIRYNRVNMDSDDVAFAGIMPGTPMYNMMNMLKNQFNMADKSVSDNNVDLAGVFTYLLNEQTDINAGVARKVRSPSYQERYLWSPTQATGGLADGRTYIGDINLDPEVSYETDLGIDWDNNKFYMTPRIFYRRVYDYIQGTPTTMMSMGQPVLQFSNIDAELYGGDMEWGIGLAQHWSLDGIISYVRGKRIDVSDNLYRIPPLNATTGLTYYREKWKATLESVLYAAQNDVSKYNNEQKSAGYGLVNLRGDYQISNKLNVVAGIDNLLDKKYANHLDGINRVTNNPDVAVGERIPGRGRNFFIKVGYDW